MGVTRSREHKTTTRLNPTVRMETTPRHPQTKPINTLQQLERIRKNNRILRTHHHAPQPPRILTQTVRESGYSIERTPQRHFHTMLICEHHAVPLMLPSMLQILPILVEKSAASVTTKFELSGLWIIRPFALPLTPRFVTENFGCDNLRATCAFLFSKPSLVLVSMTPILSRGSINSLETGSVRS